MRDRPARRFLPAHHRTRSHAHRSARLRKYRRGVHARACGRARCRDRGAIVTSLHGLDHATTGSGVMLPGVVFGLLHQHGGDGFGRHDGTEWIAAAKRLHADPLGAEVAIDTREKGARRVVETARLVAARMPPMVRVMVRSRRSNWTSLNDRRDARDRALTTACDHEKQARTKGRRSLLVRGVQSAGRRRWRRSSGSRPPRRRLEESDKVGSDTRGMERVAEAAPSWAGRRVLVKAQIPRKDAGNEQ